MATNDTDAQAAEPKKNIQVSAVITPETHAQLLELRWAKRVERVPDLVRQAIEEFVAKHGDAAKVDAAASSK